MLGSIPGCCKLIVIDGKYPQFELLYLVDELQLKRVHQKKDHFGFGMEQIKGTSPKEQLFVLVLTSADFSLFRRGLRGASVSNTGCWGESKTNLFFENEVARKHLKCGKYVTFIYTLPLLKMSVADPLNKYT